ncbi:MAG TPA: flagellar basal body L-ring protein FlgH [Pirellulaceae bacterium]|nr:flagellar basal body L-ring protein FlgH [Pirellulaceae bacterium]
MKKNDSTWFARRRLLTACGSAAISAALWSAGGSLLAQDAPNSSLFSGRLEAAMRASQPVGAGPGMPREPLPPTTSWYEIPLAPPREVKVNDIITIRVDMGSRVISEGEVQRRKQSRYDAILNDWLVLSGLKKVKPAPQSDGDQRIQGNLNQLARSTGELETTESVKFEIGTHVAAVLPNGNLVLEAHRRLLNNDEVWLVSLSCVCSRESIMPGNYVLSKDVANLDISKREYGQIRDSYKRGFVSKMLDLFSPF